MKSDAPVIQELQVTEKGTALSASANQYLFRVNPLATKSDIKVAVEDHFKVSVTKVNTMRYSGKKKRERSIKYGKKSDWKRAVVTLAEGDKIDLV